MGVNENVKRKTITNVILTLLVLSSIFLSFSLWTTGRNIGERESDSGQGSPSRLSQVTYSIEDVFRPATIALHGETGEESLVIANSYELNDFFKKTMEELELKQIERTRTLTREEYLNNLQSGRWVEFVYPEEIPFGVISSSFSDLSKEMFNIFFDRIIFDQLNSSNISFYHTKSELFHTTEMDNEEQIVMDSVLAEKDASYHKAEAVFLKNNLNYLPTEPINISYQSYIINQFPNTTYVNNLFSDTSLVDVRSTNNYTRYIDLTKEVTINENNHTLTYLSQIYTAGEMNPEERYEKSFQQINQFENWSDGLIFSSFNREDKILSFRREIQGVPIFSKNEYESLSEVSVVDDGITHMKLPLRFINIPISIKGSPEKNLMSGQLMMEELKEAIGEKELEEIEDITIGYSWLESNEDNKVINFEPDWYVLYKDKWLTYSALIDLHKETAYGL